MSLVVTRSKRYKTLGLKFEDLLLSEFIDQLVSDPTLLKQPIIFDEKKYKSDLMKMNCECLFPIICDNPNSNLPKLE